MLLHFSIVIEALPLTTLPMLSRCLFGTSGTELALALWQTSVVP
jgi:hypothetical protein